MLALRVAQRFLKARDLAIEKAALEVYESLPVVLKIEVDQFLRGVIEGRAPHLERFSKELYEAYTPVREIVRKRGSTMTLYRGEPKDKPTVVRKWLSWTPSWKLATYFASRKGYEIVEAQVRTSDVLAVFMSPNNRQYVEYLVRDRKEYHEQPSEEQVPYVGYVETDALGRDLGWPDPRSVVFVPEHARAELPRIEQAMKAVGGIVRNFHLDEENEGASVRVVLPSTVVDPDEDSVQVGPYLVDTLRPLLGRSLQARRRRPRRISVDAIVSFKVNGKKFTGKILKTEWHGSGKPMTYTWQDDKGRKVTTEGVPDDVEVLADVPARHRLG